MNFDNSVSDAKEQINVLQYFLGKVSEKETKKQENWRIYSNRLC